MQDETKHDIEEKKRQLLEKLSLIRKREKLQQAELAELTGYKQQTISRLESQENDPRLTSIINVANAFGYELKLVRKQ